MKSISYKTLSWIVNTSFILYVVGGIFLVPLLIKKGFAEKSTTFTIGIRTSDNYKLSDEIGETAILHPEVHDVKLVASKVGMEFKTNSIFIKAIFISIMIFSYLYMFSILYFLRGFVISIRGQSAFTFGSITKLRNLGILLLCLDPLLVIGTYIVRYFLTGYFTQSLLKNESIPGTIGYWFGSSTASGSFFSAWILAGLIILVVAEVFKQGLQLKQEQDLTI